MFSVTQFEVQVYHDRRWSIHARYRKNEREEAVRDAIATENSTRYPAKVIRENYYPENNTTETLTIYETPKARKLRELMTPSGEKKPKSKNLGSATSPSPKTPQATPQRLSARNVVFRILVAAAISIATTTLIVGVLAWMLRYFAQAGVSVGATMSNAILTYGYIAIFIFSFGSLFRSRLPLHRILADLWTSARTEKPAETKNRPKEAPAPLNLKPKHDRGPSPERIEEWKEMKRRRGDLDMVSEPDAEESKPRAETLTPDVSTEPVGDHKESETTQVVDARDQRDDAGGEEAGGEETAPDNAAAEGDQAGGQDSNLLAGAENKEKSGSGLESAIILRFTAEVVKPAVNAMADDPVTRRGAALVLAGAAAAIEQTSDVNSDSGYALLREMDDAAEISQYVTDSFLKHYSEHISAGDNADLVEAGHGLMKKYLSGETSLVGALSTILTEWRTPFSSRPELQPSESGATEAGAQTSLLGIYLLTELRVDLQNTGESTSQAAYDAAMGAHNSIVRASVLTFRGNEITHTGRGIFAHFEFADAALEAAADIQRRFNSIDGATVAIAVVGNSDAEEDPNFSPSLSRHAQEVVSKAADGEVLCERRIQLEARDSHAAPTTAVDDDQPAYTDMDDPLAPIAVETLPPSSYESARAS